MNESELNRGQSCLQEVKQHWQNHDVTNVLIPDNIRTVSEWEDKCNF